MKPSPSGSWWVGVAIASKKWFVGGDVSLQSKIFLLLAEVLICVQVAVYVGVNRAHDQYSKSILGKDLGVAVERFQEFLSSNEDPLRHNDYLRDLQSQMGLNLLVFEADTGKLVWGRWPTTSSNTRDDLYSLVLEKSDDRRRHLVKANDQVWMAETLVFQLPSNDRFKVLFFQETKGVLQSIQSVDWLLKLIFLLGLSLAATVTYFVVRRVIKPLQSLSQLALRVAGGEYGVKIASDGKDEIGQLSNSLARMKESLVQSLNDNQRVTDDLAERNAKMAVMNEQLERKLQETKILLQISQAMSMRLQGQSVIEIALSQLKEYFNADMVALFGYQYMSVECEIKNHVGRVFPVDGDNGDRQNLKVVMNLVNPLLTRVQQMKQPVVFSDFLTPETGGMITKDDLLTTALFPLKKNSKVIGALGLFSMNNDYKLTQEDIQFISTVASNITVLLENEYLHEETTRDNLTQLNNRAYFQEQLAEGIAAGPTQEFPVSLILFDIDHFKSFNDNHGHLVGDAILKQIGYILKRILRKNEDVLCRVGGEEFGVVLNGVPLHRVAEIAERLRKSVDSHQFLYNGREFHVTISIGYACLPNHATTVDELIEAADQAMYTSKNRGRNRVTPFITQNLRPAA